MTERAVVILRGRVQRERAKALIDRAPEDYKVTIAPSTRREELSAKFHAQRDDIARQLTWAGKPRTRLQWKNLLVSGHAAATHEETELVPGIEGEIVNIRESTADMSDKRLSSLIEYVQAFGDDYGVRWSEPKNKL